MFYYFESFYYIESPKICDVYSVTRSTSFIWQLWLKFYWKKWVILGWDFLDSILSLIKPRSTWIKVCKASELSPLYWRFPFGCYGRHLDANWWKNRRKMITSMVKVTPSGAKANILVENSQFFPKKARKSLIFT